MDSEEPKSLDAEFEAAFTFPFAKYSWNSRRARALWYDLEGWQDRLAGPISHIVTNGNCAYVYERNDEYYIGIDDPTALQIRLQVYHLKLTSSLDGFVPTTEAEAVDLEAMRQFTSKMWVVMEKAMEIEDLRWTSR